MKSIFTDKTKTPGDADLKIALGATYVLWNKLKEYVKKVAPDSTDEWKFSSEKFGWSFRISDEKRVIIYLLPRDKYFKVAFVFGQKATDSILKSKISSEIMNELKSAKVYSEGRGIRISITDKTLVNDVQKLISFKIEK